MTNSPDIRPILVIGSTGKTGKRVADQLEQCGIPVRHGSRAADVPFDWDDQQTWRPALAGVDKVYLTYYPDLAVPGSVDAVRALTGMAKEAGVSRLVLLSGRNEVEAERAEDVVKASGLRWTIVRCAFFAQNFSEGAWLDEVLAGSVALPVRDVQEPFVDADDIADVVVAALTEDRHVGQLYELTGPRLLSFGEAVAEVAAAAGRDVQFVSVSIDDYVSMLAEYGMPKDFIWLLNHLFTEVLGSKAQLADGVQRALGREPKDFAQYVRQTAATGVWGPTSP
ncbi:MULTISPECIES: NAD(P)H-binding protein [unclassified Mycobacterium]|uniref:NAD(P)H-binding protein n=1 Tax=unclassified Mycobacterium TaxID=2642494 RepID=UPI0029C75243|nr:MULTISPECIES: NAD(P)H-binding protein [unclassified Mycobacterium]